MPTGSVTSTSTHAGGIIPTALDQEIYDWVSVASAIPNRLKIEIAAMAQTTLEKKLEIYSSNNSGGVSAARQQRRTSASKPGVSGPGTTAAALATAEQLRSKLEALLVDLRSLPEDVLEDDDCGGSDDIFTDPHPDSAAGTERQKQRELEEGKRELPAGPAANGSLDGEEDHHRESLVVESKEASPS